MAPTHPTPTHLKFEVGQRIGVSDWFLIDQERIAKFGEATSDLDPMHVDPEWCARHSPFGTTVAYGFLTLSLLTHFSHDLLGWPREPEEADGYALNYGLDKVRFVAPVPANSRVRCHLTLLERTERKPGQFLQKFGVEIEVENQPRPALIAEWLGLWVTSSEHDTLNPDREQK